MAYKNRVSSHSQKTLLLALYYALLAHSTDSQQVHYQPSYSKTSLNHAPSLDFIHDSVHKTFRRSSENLTTPWYNPPNSHRIVIAQRSGDYPYGDYHDSYEVDDHSPPHRHSPSRYVVPYYHPPAAKSWFDITHVGIIVLFKIILLKLGLLGLFKLILLLMLKFPIIIITLAFKFFTIVKLIKLIKILTIPAIIPLIVIAIIPLLIFLPLLLAPLLPLLLLPILLPLLLLLPIPVLAPTTATGRKRRQAVTAGTPRGVQDDVLVLVRRVLESEQCVERVACQLAANKQASGYAPIIAWYFDKISKVVVKPKFTSYSKAYKVGSVKGTTPDDCTRSFVCNNPRSLI